MNMTKKSIYFALCALALVAMTSCEPKALKMEDVFVPDSESTIDSLIADGRLYGLNEFLDTFMTEQGNFWSDTSLYRSRATNGNGIYLYSVDTLPTNGPGIYIMGRVTTDDYGGNFYKALVIQQIGEDGKQQNLRISVDMGSVGGQYQIGQLILIRCNGLAVGRYANQPQLCVPAYNNNIYALNATQKVGWAPGRIPAPKFRNAVKMIGLPDKTKIKYDTLSLKALFDEVPVIPTVDAVGMDQVRKADGRLVVITKVHFSGYCNDDGAYTKCIYAHPDSSSIVNVFASTTNNVGYPQSRILQNSSGNLSICFSNSEYSKFANFFLPGAQQDTLKAVTYCDNWEGTVTGILGWYCDNATNTNKGLQKLSGYEWSVTPRGIPGIGIADIEMKHKTKGTIWEPQEFNPVYYRNYMHGTPINEE